MKPGVRTLPCALIVRSARYFWCSSSRRPTSRMRLPWTAIAPSQKIRRSASSVRTIPPETSRSHAVGPFDSMSVSNLQSAKCGHYFGTEAPEGAQLVGSDEEKLEMLDTERARGRDPLDDVRGRTRQCELIDHVTGRQRRGGAGFVEVAARVLLLHGP